MILYENLKALRTEKGLSQEQLAEKLNISRQAIAKWESGLAAPELEKLVALADLYQTPLDELVRGTNPCAHHRLPTADRDTEALIDFLLRAGAKTYAGSGEEAVTPSRPGAHDLFYEEGEYRYVDTYLGGQRFVGEEALYHRSICVWGMNYSGRTLAEGFSGDFLKAALLLRPKELPYRGPRLYRDGRYTYHNDVKGDFDWFIGREEIFCDERCVFECIYHGGRVLA